MPRVILTSIYDAGSNRTGLSASIAGTDDFENSYSYDQLNRLRRVDQIGVSGGNTVSEKRVDFAYMVDSRFETIARYNDTAGGSGDELATSTYSYDSLGRLTGLDYEQGGTDLFTPYAWTYDDLSRITQFTNADGTSDYSYDLTDQLTDATHSYQTNESYSYDANGNRTNTGYTTGDDNRLTNDGTFSYTYDDEGNRTKRTNDTTSEETLYEWDFRNRLTKVTEKDGSGTTTKVVEYTYDVFDRRIGKEVDSSSPFDMADAVIERYVYDDLSGVNSVDGGNVVLDFVDPDGTGSTSIALEKRRLFGNAVDQILAEEDVTVAASSADRVYWPLVDHLGTVRDLVKNDGTLGEHYEYDSFGNVTAGDTSLTRYLFTSREQDEDTGLQYNRARWYDAAVGRWISQDPIGFAAGDANLYRYVGNAVALLVDPSGLDSSIASVSEDLIAADDTAGSFFHGFWNSYTDNVNQWDGSSVSVDYGDYYFKSMTKVANVVAVGSAAAAVGIAAGTAIAGATVSSASTAIAMEVADTTIEYALSQATGVTWILPMSPLDLVQDSGKLILKKAVTQLDVSPPATVMSRFDTISLPMIATPAAATSRRHTPDQQALIELVDDVTNSGRRPLTPDEADIVLDWADEVGHSGVRADPGAVADPSNWNANPVPHIHIPGAGRSGHVPVRPGVRPRPMRP